jgi:hypothetical protein
LVHLAVREALAAVRMIATWTEQPRPKPALMRQTSYIVSATRSSMTSGAAIGARCMKNLTSREKYKECRRRSAERLPLEIAASNRRSVMSARGSDTTRSARSGSIVAGTSVNDCEVAIAASQQDLASAGVPGAGPRDGMELSDALCAGLSMVETLGARLTAADCLPTVSFVQWI